MKSRLIPVIFTAALTSVTTMFIAGKYQEQLPFLTTSQKQVQLPVNYAHYSNAAMVRSTPPADFQDAAEASVKAVVHVKTTTKARAVTAYDPNDFFGQFFGPRQYMLPPQMGSGSGVVVSPDGYIATNNHVVAGADQVTVTFNDRYTAQAKVVATDPSTDLAVLKVNENNLSYIEIGNSDNVRLGQWVLAVGYPLTLDATVTAGIVSARGRSIGINRSQSKNAIEAFIQTDAAVNPGNSGGALVNTEGQLIGINSAIASPTGSYAGYSYAIPSNIVKKVVNDLMQYGSVQRAYLGIEYRDRKGYNAEQLSALRIDKTEGVYVEGVLANSGAANAGIQKGDFITAINGTPIHTEPELQEQLARYKPGDNISVSYLRSGITRNTTVQLRNVEGNTNIIKQQGKVKLLGASFRSLNNDEKRKYNVSGGVIVENINEGLISEQTNMKKGFVITSVNDKTVKTVDELQQVLASSKSAQIAGFQPGSRGMYYYGINNLDESVAAD
ncbi:MAG: HtrA2 peptidase [Flavipsychrobacter sp.]|nr:HtrA2 peptidase [Flavipsychrobacter sp.]